MSVTLTPRQKKIIILLYENSHRTIEGIAQSIDISSTTVRNDLVCIQNFLEETGLGKLDKKTGIGVMLHMTDIQKQRMLDMLPIQNLGTNCQYTDRKIFIIESLLHCDGQFITMNSLADHLFVSKTSVQRSLKDVEEWFTRFDITIIKRQHRGISLQYDEINLRKVLEEFFYLVYNETTRIEPLLAISAKRKLADIDLAVLGRVFKGFDYEKAIGIVDIILDKNSMDITPDYYKRLVLQLCILIIRRKSSKVIPDGYILPDDIKNCAEYTLATQMCKLASNQFSIRMYPNDTAYMALYLIASELRIPANAELLAANAEYWKNINVFTDEVINMLSSILDKDLAKDNLFRNNLLLFLRGMIFRLKYSITNRNPFLTQIKELYPDLYGAAWSVSILFDRYYQLSVNENEVGFLCLHIGGAVEKISYEIKAIIVCNYGVGISHLMNEMLCRSIPGLKITDILSSFKYKNYRNNDYDFVITTIDLPAEDKHIIKVNSILTDSEVDKIKAIAKLIQKDNNYRKSISYFSDSKPCASVFEHDLIFWNEDFKTKNQVIEFLCDQLFDQKCITRSFVQSVYDRESVCSTEVGSMIAIPHGCSKFVKKSRIAVLKLKRPIIWANYNKVNLIFMTAFNLGKNAKPTDEMQKFYLLLTKLLEDKAFTDKIRNLESREEFYKYIILNNQMAKAADI